MQLWVAIKLSPLGKRDPVTHVNHCRLDQFSWLLPVLGYSFANHAEAVLVHPCEGPRTRSASGCPVCTALPPAEARDQYEYKHYVAYSVDQARNCVFRSVGRHVVAPQVVPENDEYWTYYKIPVSAAEAMLAFRFLEEQMGKRFRAEFMWKFFWPWCRREVEGDADPWKAEAWHCSELTAATLSVCWPAFDEALDRPFSMVSPCVLQSILVDLLPPEASDHSSIPVPLSVRSVGRS